MQNPDLGELGFKVSPHEVPVASVKGKKARRAKHWFRLCSRRSTDGGKTWSSWMRFSWGQSDYFKTRAEAKAEVKKAQDKCKKEQARGYALMDFGGLTASMKVEKDQRQYMIFEEVTLNVSDELIG